MSGELPSTIRRRTNGAREPIELDEFKFVTPLSRFDHCLQCFEPKSCRDCPVHLVLKSDQLKLTNARHVRTIAQSSTPPAADAAADPSFPFLVTFAGHVRQKRWFRQRMCQAIINIIRFRPRAFHKVKFPQKEIPFEISTEPKQSQKYHNIHTRLAIQPMHEPWELLIVFRPNFFSGRQ